MLSFSAQLLLPGLQAAHEEASEPENKPKNRYITTLPCTYYARIYNKSKIINVMICKINKWGV